MLGRVKVSEDLSELKEISFAIDGWQNENYSTKNIQKVFTWYEKNLKDNKSLNVYRGISIDKTLIKPLLRGKSIPLNSPKKYSSWTVDPVKAVGFTGWFGIVLSHKLSSKDNYLDVNESVSYISKRGVPAYDGFYSECEIITDAISCESCSLKDIEMFSFSSNHIDMENWFDVISTYDLDYTFNGEEITYDLRKRINGGGYSFCLFKNRDLIPSYSIKSLVKHFRIKPNTDCI